jgi:hypothetical protein
MGIVRTDVRLCGLRHDAILSDRKPFVGEGCPAAVFMDEAGHSQDRSVAVGRYFDAGEMAAKQKSRPVRGGFQMEQDRTYL